MTASIQNSRKITPVFHRGAAAPLLKGTVSSKSRRRAASATPAPEPPFDGRRPPPAEVPGPTERRSAANAAGVPPLGPV